MTSWCNGSIDVDNLSKKKKKSVIHNEVEISHCLVSLTGTKHA